MILQRRFTLVASAVCLALVGVPPAAVEGAELLGYWSLDEIAGPAVDLSGNGLDGTYENDANPNVSGAPGFGSGVEFDGTDDQILIGGGFATGLGNLTNSFTVMGWINPDNFDSKNRAFGSAPTGAGWGWGTADDSLQITTYGVKDYTQPVPLVAGEWAHAAIVLDGNNDAHFYHNGNFLGTQTHPSPGTPIDNDFYIGFSCCAAEHFDGKLDEVAVFSGELTEQQIQNAMNLGVLSWNIPEPSSYACALVCVGLLGLIAGYRRRL